MLVQRFPFSVLISSVICFVFSKTEHIINFVSPAEGVIIRLFFGTQEDKIETLKRSSRLIHYCAAPLLFHPNWRRKRSSTASHSDTVKEESFSDEPRKEIKEKKNSKEQKHDEG